MPDPLGNVNNWIFVGAPGAPPTVASAACATAQVQHPAQVSGPPPYSCSSHALASLQMCSLDGWLEVMVMGR